jgi:glycerol-3-phosphate dehydrogenase (NAD(P)+)
MDVCVLGAGAWGTALAISAGERHASRLWARDAAQAAAIVGRGREPQIPSGLQLPAGVAVETGPGQRAGGLARRHELVIVASPMAGLRELLTHLSSCGRPVAWLCKGFETPTGLLLATRSAPKWRPV